MPVYTDSLINNWTTRSNRAGYPIRYHVMVVWVYCRKWRKRLRNQEIIRKRFRSGQAKVCHITAVSTKLASFNQVLFSIASINVRICRLRKNRWNLKLFLEQQKIVKLLLMCLWKTEPMICTIETQTNNDFETIRTEISPKIPRDSMQ